MDGCLGCFLNNCLYTYGSLSEVIGFKIIFTTCTCVLRFRTSFRYHLHISSHKEILFRIVMFLFSASLYNGCLDVTASNVRKVASIQGVTRGRRGDLLLLKLFTLFFSEFKKSKIFKIIYFRLFVFVVPYFHFISLFI